MRAALLREFGRPLRVEDAPEPTPGAGEVLFEARFIGVNPVDVWVTDGSVAGGKQPLPFVPGVEAVGLVDGRHVLVHGGGLGLTRDGTYRERAAVPEDSVLDVPSGADLQQVAGLGVPGPTAWSLLHVVAKVTAQDRVLVLGASGGVGSLVVQLARAVGAVTWGQTSAEAKAAFVRGLGADRAVVVAHPDALPEAVAELRPTVVIDPLANGYTAAAIATIEPFGRIALYGASAGPEANVDLRSLYRKSVQLLTYSGTIEPEERVRAATLPALDALARGELRVSVDEVLPLEEADEAHRRIRERQVRGKLLLAP